jgi:hypothetical protein
VETHLNRDAPYDDVDEVLDALVAMRQREEVEFSRGDKGFDPPRRVIARAMTTTSCPCAYHLEDDDAEHRRTVYVSLSPVGERAWDRIFEPDWDRYVDIHGFRDGLDLRARSHDVLDRVLGRLGRVGVEVDASRARWLATDRWWPRGWFAPLPQPAPGHRVVVPCTSITDLPCTAAEAVCPRWCSPWSHQSRWRASALDEGDGADFDPPPPELRPAPAGG